MGDVKFHQGEHIFHLVFNPTWAGKSRNCRSNDVFFAWFPVPWRHSGTVLIRLNCGPSHSGAKNK